MIDRARLDEIFGRKQPRPAHDRAPHLTVALAERSGRDRKKPRSCASAQPPNFALPCALRWSMSSSKSPSVSGTELVRSRSEEHTSELQSRRDLVCRLLLEKKKN